MHPPTIVKVPWMMQAKQRRTLELYRHLRALNKQFAR